MKVDPRDYELVRDFRWEMDDANKRAAEHQRLGHTDKDCLQYATQEMLVQDKMKVVPLKRCTLCGFEYYEVEW